MQTASLFQNCTYNKIEYCYLQTGIMSNKKTDGCNFLLRHCSLTEIIGEKKQNTFNNPRSIYWVIKYLDDIPHVIYDVQKM